MGVVRASRLRRFPRGHDFGFYIYTPESDEVLRKNWRGAWSTADWAALVESRAHYVERGVGFGLGWSLYELNVLSRQRAHGR